MDTKRTLGDRVNRQRGWVNRSRVFVAIVLVITSLTVLLQNPLPVAATSSSQADLVGVSGNAFPWEAHWSEFSNEIDQSHIGWARLELRWNQVEPNRNQWDWGGTDLLVNSYAPKQMNLLGLLGYSVAWANGGSGNATVFGPPQDMDAWEAYVRATVSRYKDRIHSWEIWNEPDVAMFWNGQDGGDPVVYQQVLQRAYRAIKSVDPNATVMNGGLTGTERGANFLNTLINNGGGSYLDAVAFHGYVENGSVDSLFYYNVIWPLIRQARQNANKPLWITEYGWSSGSSGGSSAGSEAAQENLIARQFSMLFDLGDVAHVFIFQFKDPNNQPNFFGLTRPDATTKPAYTAVSTIAGRLIGLQFQEHLDTGITGLWVQRFSNASRTVDVVWSQPNTQTVSLPVTATSVTIWHMNGSSESKTVSGGHLTLTVGTDPVLVERTGQDLALFQGGNCQFFAPTNQTACNQFLDFWNKYGGLSIFGYPISGELKENGLTVQYFERAKLEFHPEWAGTDWAVVGELMGRSVTQGRQNDPAFQPIANGQSDANCNFYQETGHRLCAGFRTYWQDHGGLWMFGFPISEEFQEKNPDTGQVYTVQYFERARFEYHPEYAGTPYEVLLGRLGAQLYAERYGAH